jgi:uncharacterized protein (TIGR02246 family)
LHRRVEECMNAGDVNGLVELYEPTALLLGPEGEVAAGLEAIRAAWTASVALGGQTKLVTRFVVVADDVALLSNDWTMEGDGWSATATTAEVARRQADGTWRYVIDNPFFAVSETG